MRKIVFLDIDGVLRNQASNLRTDCSFFSVEADCATILRDVVKKLDIKLVLSSTWRYRGDTRGHGLGFWRAKDAIRDAIGWAAPFIGVTPDLSSMEKENPLWKAVVRETECLDWIAKFGRPGDEYVAIDDEGSFDNFIKNGGRLIRTDPTPGLTAKDAEAIEAAFEEILGQRT